MTERRVECLAENGSSSDWCLSHLKPAAQRLCHGKDCKSLMVGILHWPEIQWGAMVCFIHSPDILPHLFSGEATTSCKGIQSREKIRKDGEYLLNVKGQMIKVLLEFILGEFNLL